MKKISIILTIIIILLIDVLRPLYLTLWQLNWKANIRRELKSEVKNYHLLEFTFSKYDLNNKIVYLKFIRNDEFIYNNQMYDVLETFETTDSISYICYLDLKEMLQISSLINITLGSGLLSPLLPLLKNQLIQYTYYIIEKNIRNSIKSISKLIVFFKNIEIISREIEVRTPPPKV